jgi:hypothetical protein
MMSCGSTARCFGKIVAPFHRLMIPVPAGKVPRRLPKIYANLSGMSPELSRTLKSVFAANPPEEISQSGAARPASEARHADTAQVDHHSQVCPTCGNRLTGHRCKLVCRHCGYYMSCADYY